MFLNVDKCTLAAVPPFTLPLDQLALVLLNEATQLKVHFSTAKALETALEKI